MNTTNIENLTVGQIITMAGEGLDGGELATRAGKFLTLSIKAKVHGKLSADDQQMLENLAGVIGLALAAPVPTTTPDSVEPRPTFCTIRIF